MAIHFKPQKVKILLTTIDFVLKIVVFSLLSINSYYEWIRIKIKASMSNQIKPTETELEILQILWQNGASSVREINDIMNNSREVGYTTTLKLMQIMNEKELTVRDTANRTHIYQANVEEKKIKSGLLESFINNAFRGSASSLVMQVLGQSNASEDELNQIKQMIEKIESNK